MVHPKLRNIIRKTLDRMFQVTIERPTDTEPTFKTHHGDKVGRSTITSTLKDMLGDISTTEIEHVIQEWEGENVKRLTDLPADLQKKIKEYFHAFYSEMYEALVDSFGGRHKDYADYLSNIHKKMSTGRTAYSSKMVHDIQGEFGSKIPALAIGTLFLEYLSSGGKID